MEATANVDMLLATPFIARLGGDIETLMVDQLLGIRLADMEAALEGHRAGSLTSEDAVGALERLLAVREGGLRAQLVQLLEAKVGGGAGESAPGSLEAAVRSVFAQLQTEAPTNWHQGTVYFTTSTEQQDKHMKARAPLLLFGGTLMVLLQCMTTAGLFFGSISSSCENNDQCPPSQFCWRGASHR